MLSRAGPVSRGNSEFSGLRFHSRFCAGVGEAQRVAEVEVDIDDMQCRVSEGALGVEFGFGRWYARRDAALWKGSTNTIDGC